MSDHRTRMAILGMMGALSLPLWAAAQQGTFVPLNLDSPLQGIVLDESTGQPVADATLTIVGTDYRTSANAYGMFAFPDPPMGRVSVRAAAPDMVTLVEEVDVRADVITQIEFHLPPLDALLAEFLVPSGDRVSSTEPTTAADLVARRVPGLMLPVSSVGDDERAIRLRGVNTFTQGSEPHLFIDGVRVTGTSTIYNTLTQIPASDVERIDVLRGPAAAFLHQYAANGVIHVYTRSGSSSEGN